MTDIEIINTKIENNILTITLNSTNSVSKVYLDSVLAKNTYHSTEDTEHDIVINSPQMNDTTITIDITEYNATSFIVSVVGNNTTHAIAYDEKNLYYQKVNMLTTFCYTCLDKHQKEKILMLQFKSQLLDYAVSNRLTEDAIEYYIDICRLLDIPSNHTCCKYNRVWNCHRPCKTCRSCCNGCCSL